MGPYLSAIYKGQEPADTKPVTKKAVHAEIVAAEQTAPVIERLTYACEENNQKEINSVCDTIVAEMDAAKREVAAYGTDIDKWASDEIKARVEKALAERDNKIDVILSHTTPLKYEPTEVFLSGIDQSKVDKSTEQWLDKIEENVEYKKWYCGHYHTNKKIDKVSVLFEDIAVFGV